MQSDPLNVTICVHYMIKRILMASKMMMQKMISKSEYATYNNIDNKQQQIYLTTTTNSQKIC